MCHDRSGDFLNVIVTHRGSDPAEYPTSLLDSQPCVRQLLDHIYSLLQVYPTLPKKVRDAKIVERYAGGTSIAALAQAYHLSESRVRWIIRHTRRKID